MEPFVAPLHSLSCNRKACDKGEHCNSVVEELTGTLIQLNSVHTYWLVLNSHHQLRGVNTPTSKPPKKVSLKNPNLDVTSFIFIWVSAVNNNKLFNEIGKLAIQNRCHL